MRFYRGGGRRRGSRCCVNSIGDPACRPAYIEALTAYYRRHAAALPPTERDRLERNVLRLLDSKDPAMAELNEAAPRITDHLCEPCASHLADGALAPGGARCPVSGRERPRPGARLLHADGVRVLRHGSRGAAAGAGRRRPLRRPDRAPRRPADTGDRVRSGPRPGRACAGRAGCRPGHGRGTGRGRHRRQSGRYDHPAPGRDQAARCRDPMPGRPRASQAGARSWRPRARTARTSR